MLYERVAVRENFLWVDFFGLERAEPLKGTPQGRVQLQRLSVVFDGFLLLTLELADLAEQVEASGAVWHFFQLLGVHKTQRPDVVLFK